MALGVGDQAPDFELPGTGSAQYRLSSYRGRVVVIVFYPGDNTAVCTRQLNSYNQGLDEFEKLGAQVLATSGSRYLPTPTRALHANMGCLDQWDSHAEACLSLMPMAVFPTPTGL